MKLTAGKKLETALRTVKAFLMCIHSFVPCKQAFSATLRFLCHS